MKSPVSGKGVRAVIPVLVMLAALIPCSRPVYAVPCTIDFPFPTTVFQEESVIHEGVYAESIDLAGKSSRQAAQAVEEYLQEMGNAVITLECVSGNTISVKASQLGLTWKNPLIVQDAARLGEGGNLVRRYKETVELKTHKKVYDIEIGVDREKVTAVLSQNCAVYNVPPVNATLIPKSNGGFDIVDGKNGQIIDVENSADKVCGFFENEFDGSDSSIALVIKEAAPKGDRESLAQIKDTLGSYTTSYASSSNDRATNVSSGCSHINGSLLYPGEQFSVYEHVSPFTEENGYRLAGSYSNGLVVESLGGGICQVASTLYQAALRAELQIDKRYNHSMAVSYVPHSGDAAIAGTTKDLKFTNNTDYPVYISGVTSNREITFRIYGVETRPSSRTLKFESVDTATEEPGPEQVVADRSQPAGYTRIQSAHTGYSSEFWKIIYENGTEVDRKKINTSYYKATPRTLTMGTATDNPVTTQAIRTAISTQDINYCRSVASSIAVDGGAGALKKAQEAEAAKALASQAAASQQAAAAQQEAAQQKAEAQKAAEASQPSPDQTLESSETQPQDYDEEGDH